MIKALLFSTPDGGIGQYTYCLCQALQAAQSVEPTVLVHETPAYDMSAFPHRHRVKPDLRWPQGRWGKIAAPSHNLRCFAREARRADLVHFQWNNGPRFDRMNWNWIKRAGKPIVYTAHDVQPHERSPEDQEHNVWMARNADAVIVHGESLKQTLLSLSGIAPERVHVLPHGNFQPIAEQFPQWDRARARASFGFEDDEQALLFFGYVRPYKGLDTLIEACAQVRDARPERRFRLLIAGRTLSNFWEEGGYAGRIEKAGLAERTTYAIEYVPMADVARYFLAADIVTLPYKSGSQSGILQMAYAYARPVVVTDVGSIGEVVQSGRTGLVVAPDDPPAFAAALLTLLDDPAAALQIGAQGRAYAETELSWSRIAAATARVYQAVLAGQRQEKPR